MGNNWRNHANIVKLPDVAMLCDLQFTTLYTCFRVHCRVTVSPFWTNSTHLTFNFTGLTSTSDLHITWGLGTSPGACDTVPYTIFTGQQISNVDFIADGDLLQGITISRQDYSLVNNSLTEGQTYFVTVRAQDLAGTVVAQVTSAAVKVRHHWCTMRTSKTIYKGKAWFTCWQAWHTWQHPCCLQSSH